MGRHAFNHDWLTILLLFIIGLFGLSLLLSVSQALFWQQALFVGIGIILVLTFSRSDSVLLYWLAPFGYILSIAFIILSYLSPSIRGASRWILIGGAQLQPSELVKPLLLLAFSRFLVQFPPRQMKNIPILGALFLIPFILVFKQPDLGTSLVYGVAFLAMVWAAGLPFIVPLVMVPVTVVGVPLVWKFLAGYQKARIFTFINPALDPAGAGYNALQAVIAVGSGQWFGRGLGFGTQSHLRFLPEYHTDFIFASLIEELGLVGGLALLLLYALLLWRILQPLVRGQIEDPFVYLYSVGLFSLILAQIFINAGMNMGLLPITGITLPLVSYGGSSIFSLCISFGILWALRSGKNDTSSIAIT